MGINFRIGQTESLKKTIQASEINLVSGMCCDFHPEHTNMLHTKDLGYQGLIVPEIILVGLINSVMKNKLPGYGFKLLRQQVEYLHPVIASDTVEVKVTIKDWMPEKRLLVLRLACFSQNGNEVITGEAIMIHQAES